MEEVNKIYVNNIPVYMRRKGDEIHCNIHEDNDRVQVIMTKGMDITNQATVLRDMIMTELRGRIKVVIV
jgi:hypothetical protein